MKAKLNTPVKKALFGVVAAAVAIGIVWGILALLRNARRQDVNVYEVSSFSTYDYSGGDSQSSGSVTTDKLQKVFTTETQTVKEIYVKEGDTVKKGDRLFSYDSSLSDIQLKQAEINVERKKLNVTDTEQALSDLKAAKSTEELTTEQATLEAKLAVALKKYRPTDTDVGVSYIPTTQDGTQASPWYALYTTDLALSSLQEGYTVLYKEVSGVPENYLGIRRTGDSISFFTPVDLPVSDDPASGKSEVVKLQTQLTEIETLLETSLTKSALAKAITEKTQALEAAKIEAKLAELDLSTKKKEIGDNTVYSEVDGVVKAVRDAAEAYKNSQAVVEVSGGGGYYITGAISEMDLGAVTVGQTATVSSWQTGYSCEGTIVSIENYPTTETGWSNGNPNVSWYPFKIFVDEDAQLQSGDYVDISYRSSGSGDSAESWFLENEFLRSENGRSYVMMRGEDGTLQKQWVQTGRSLWGSYTEICGGLTQEDWVAFPYGKDTVEGAKTREATSDELYNLY